MRKVKTQSMYLLILFALSFLVFFMQRRAGVAAVCGKVCGHFWTGTTNQGLRVYFRVRETGAIDTMSVRFRLGSGTITCLATFALTGTANVNDSGFLVSVRIPGTNVSTTVEGSFNAENAVSGTYQGIAQPFSLLCGIGEKALHIFLLHNILKSSMSCTNTLQDLPLEHNWR